MRIRRGTALAFVTAAAAVPLRASAGEKLVLAQYGIAATTVPFAVALERGLFKEQGLDIDGFIGSNGGGSTVRNMMANGVPFSEVGTPAVIAAVRAGIPLRIVYASTNNMGETSWVVRKDAPIHALADLRGKKIGYIGPQSATEVVSRLILQHAGLAQNVQFVPTGGQGGAETALDTGAVDAIPLSDPVLSQTTTGPNPKYRVVFRVTQELPHFTNGVGVVTADYAKSNPEVVRKLILARAKAVDFIYAHPDETAAVYAKVWRADLATARAAVANLIRLRFWSDGSFTPASMDTVDEGMKLISDDPQTLPSWRSITDPSFLPPRRR